MRISELIAGLSTFFTASYLLLLYPKILSEGGIDFGAATTATILTITFSSLFLAFYADFPALLVTGLSVGPYLVYSVILKQGASWPVALGLVFWAGLAIFLLTLFKVRQKILFHLPSSIKSAAIAGIGVFLICVGLKNLGFPSVTAWNFDTALAGFGLCLFFGLYYFRIQSAFLLTILFLWGISLLLGMSRFHGLVAWPASMSATFFQLRFWIGWEWLGTLLSVILIALFDSSASLTVLARLAYKVDAQGKIKGVDRIMIPDGLGSMFGALLGTGTLTYALESSAGIKAGGRNKWTAIVAATACLVGLFFYPLISSIPLFAITPIIISIGIFMTLEIRQISWKELTESIPALFMIVTIPLTFSIYLGFAFGFTSYVLLMIVKGRLKEVHPVCWVLALIFAAHLSWTFIRLT